TVWLNGTSVIQATDSSVKAAGFAGIYNQGGIHNGILLDNYLVSDSGPASPQPPSVPASPNPTAGANDVNTTPILAWGAAGAATYDVRLGMATTRPVVATTTSASYTTAPLTAGATYYWQVVAYNSAGSTVGPLWSFTTSAPPAIPTITGLSQNSGPVAA